MGHVGFGAVKGRQLFFAETDGDAGWFVGRLSVGQAWTPAWHAGDDVEGGGVECGTCRFGHFCSIDVAFFVNLETDDYVTFACNTGMEQFLLQS